MALIKFLLLLLTPPVLNWLVGRFWETYRELRLHRLVFWAWVTAVTPAVILIAAGVAQAVDQANGRSGDNLSLGSFELPGHDDLPNWAGAAPAVDFVTDETDYGAMISQAAGRHGLDPVLFTAQIKQESQFDPQAEGMVGEQGFGQLMPVIKDWCGLVNGYDPHGNLDCSARFMAYLMDKYQSPALALAAYNAGEPAVDACNCVPTGIPVQYVKAINVYYNEYLSSVVMGGALDMATAVRLLYMGSQPEPTQGWHPSVAPLPQAQDWAAGCKTPLYSPVPGTAVVKYVGDDGLGNGTTMIVVEGPGGTVTLLHGDYTVLQGSAVVGGVTQIGTEKDNGDATGCHSHVAPGPWSR